MVLGVCRFMRRFICILLVLFLLSTNTFFIKVDAMKEEDDDKGFLGGVMDSDWPSGCGGLSLDGILVFI